MIGLHAQIVATRCHLLRLKCTKFDFGWGPGPDPAWRAHSAPPDSVVGFETAYFYGGRGRKGRGKRRKGRRRKGEGGEERGKVRKGRRQSVQ